ncbi:hypothetical protein CEXT_230581 [Caerostris extrusa]|uniref:Ribosomal protein S4 n=1 Tax=Caerostris extrusa TaxID=172846 RepID=A0AAV4U9Q5_CAEEX|nr:hypothetical protein CEXT_230581 [Caerostris extrusa]
MFIWPVKTELPWRRKRSGSNRSSLRDNDPRCLSDAEGGFCRRNNALLRLPLHGIRVRRISILRTTPILSPPRKSSAGKGVERGMQVTSTPPLANHCSDGNGKRTRFERSSKSNLKLSQSILRLKINSLVKKRIDRFFGLKRASRSLGKIIDSLALNNDSLAKVRSFDQKRGYRYKINPLDIRGVNRSFD